MCVCGAVEELAVYAGTGTFPSPSHLSLFVSIVSGVPVSALIMQNRVHGNCVTQGKSQKCIYSESSAGNFTYLRHYAHTLSD